MEIDKQKLLVAHLLSDHDLYATCHGIIKSSYFDPSIKRVVNFSQEYFEKYKNIPSPDKEGCEGWWGRRRARGRRH
jgi:hypothetical protein